MQRSLVLQLQEAALDSKIKTSELLRIALLVATKLDLEEMIAWVESELGGYDEIGDNFPAYRRLYGQPKALHPYQGWTPLQSTDAGFMDTISRATIHMGIAELENLVETGDELVVTFPHNLAILIQQAYRIEYPVAKKISSAAVRGTISAVRDAVLRWALSLEKEGIVGEGFQFTSKEEEMAKRSIQHVTNYYERADGANIQQGNENAIQVITNDSEQLRDLLKAIKELIASLDHVTDVPETRTRLQADASTLVQQIESGSPNPTIIHEAKKSIRTVLEGLTSGVAVEFLKRLAGL